VTSTSLRSVSLRSVAAALAAALVLTAGTIAGSSPDRALAADPCTWTLHSKRVVKRKRVMVNGHKRFKKVKRIKRWWSCDPVVNPPIEETPPDRLLVRALDAPFRFQLSRSSVVAGDVTVQLNNRSMDAHDLHIRPLESSTPEYVIPELAPGTPPQGSLAEDTFNLTPGTWYLWCDLLDHETTMNASLVVN
jgi:hypothetical protein